jgi:hypothetical protein
MPTNASWPVPGRPAEEDAGSQGVTPSCPPSHEPPPAPGGLNSGFAADAVAPSNQRPAAAATFEGQEIPAAFREAVEKELTGDEKLLWVGRPSRNAQVRPPEPMLKVVGIGLLALAAVTVLFSLVAGGGVFGVVFAVFLALIGLAFLLPWLVKQPTAARCCYAITSRRALLVEASVWRKAAVQSYLPHQLLGLERRDNDAVPGAGDLIFEYVFALPGQSFNLATGAAYQRGPGAGSSTTAQRVPRGFLDLDQVREVEALLRRTLLGQLEQALDAPAPAAADRAGAAQAVGVVCACGTTLAAPADAGGKVVECPRCLAAVAVGPRQAPVPASCREDGMIPADLKHKLLSGLEGNERPVWIGQPVSTLVLVRNGGYFALAAVGVLVSLVWLLGTLTPPKTVAVRQVQGRRVVVTQVKQQPGNPLKPLVLFLVAAGVGAVPLVRRHFASRTAYLLTTRRAVVYKEGLFGPTREVYSPMEVSAVRRSDSWFFAGHGDLIFRTVQVISTSRTRGRASSSVKTTHYGFLAVAHVGEVEKLLRETLIDRFADKLRQANAL